MAARPELSCFSTRCYSWLDGKIAERRRAVEQRAGQTAFGWRRGEREGTSVEVLSPGFFHSMPGRTFKSKRGCSRRKQQLRRRSPFLSSFARCRRSRSRCQSLYRSCLRTIEELIKIIASHSITYPPFVLHLFSFSNVFQHCILPPPIFLAVRTSTYRINETTLSSNLSSIKHPKKKKESFPSVGESLSLCLFFWKQGDGPDDNNQRCSRLPIIRAQPLWIFRDRATRYPSIFIVLDPLPINETRNNGDTINTLLYWSIRSVAPSSLSITRISPRYRSFHWWLRQKIKLPSSVMINFYVLCDQ